MNNLQDFHVEETLNNKDTLYRSDVPDAGRRERNRTAKNTNAVP